MDLREAGIREGGAALMGSPDCRDVAAHRVRGEEVRVAVAACREDHRVGGMGLELAGDEVAGDDSLGDAVDEDEVEELMAGGGGGTAPVGLVLRSGKRGQGAGLAGR